MLEKPRWRILSLPPVLSKETQVDVSAAVTSKGQVTIPREVRDALGLHDGDRVIFRVVDGAAVIARTGDLLELAGTIPVPAGAPAPRVRDERQAAQRAQARRSA